MTLAEIEKMDDRELDAAVAEKVMGWPGRTTLVLVYRTADDVDVWSPSTDIAAALEALNKFPVWGIDYDSDEGSPYVVTIVDPALSKVIGGNTAKSLPRAICTAALLAAEAGEGGKQEINDG